jgi:stage IV sporulation protein FB
MKILILSGIPELFLLGSAFILGGGERIFDIFTAALLHECGHMAAATLLGARLRFFRAGIAGLSLRYDVSLLSHIREALICPAGPAVGLTVVILCRRQNVLQDFAAANAALAIFNLLPVSCLDGGGFLRAILSVKFSPDTVWRVCRGVSFVITFLLWCLSVCILIHVKGDISSAAVSIYLLYRLFSEICPLNFRQITESLEN